MKPKKNYKEKTIKSIRLDSVIWKIIKDLTPFYGSSEGEVVRNIVLMWLHENLGSNTIKELKQINAIKLDKLKEEILDKEKNL